MDRRNAELRKIHVLARQLGLEDEAYRDMLAGLTGKRSAKDLDDRGRAKVLDHLVRGAPTYRPHNLRSPNAPAELSKVEALLAEANRPWSYANSMAKRMWKVDRAEWCSPEQLRGLITALIVDARRHGRRTE